MRVMVLLDCPTWSEHLGYAKWYERDERLKALVSGALSYNGIKLNEDTVYCLYLEPNIDKGRYPTGHAKNIPFDKEYVEANCLFDNITHILISEYIKPLIDDKVVFENFKTVRPPQHTVLLTWLFNLDKIFGDSLKEVGVKDPVLCASIPIESVKDMEEAVKACFITGVCTFDLETAGLKYWDSSKIITILSFSAQPGTVYSVALQHHEAPQISRWTETILDIFRTVLESPDIDKIAHNAKFDIHWLRRYHNVFNYQGRWYDTMIMAQLINENRKVNLKDLARPYFPEYAGYELKLKTDEEWATCPMHLLRPYADIDVHQTQMLRIIYEEELLKDERLYRFFRSMSMPVMRLLEEIEYNGMPVNRPFVKESIDWITAQIEKYEFDIRMHPSYINYEKHRKLDLEVKMISEYQIKQEKHKEGSKWWTTYQTRIQEIKQGLIVIEPLNFASPKQVEGFLFSKEGLNLPNMGTTAYGVLKDFNNDWVEMYAILKHLYKMEGTYYQPIYTMSAQDSKLHGSLNQVVARTGRLSSSEPNLQNLPVRTPLKHPIAKEAVKRVKQFFAAPEGYSFIGGDMSQAELRTIANVSGDKTMIESYLKGIDLHTLTASRIYSEVLNRPVSYEEFLGLKITAPDIFTLYRTMAKGANFGLVYGAQAKTYIRYLLENYGVLIDEKGYSAHSNAIFGTYIGLKPWHKTYEERCKKFGYVRSLFGRKRNLPDVWIKGNDKISWSLRSKALRNAINSPIQGTSAEYCLLSMVLIRWRLHYTTRLINNIHDAVYSINVQKHNKFVCAVMGETFKDLPVEKLFEITKERSPVPMGVDIQIGTNWSNIEDISYEPVSTIPW